MCNPFKKECSRCRTYWLIHKFEGLSLNLPCLQVKEIVSQALLGQNNSVLPDYTPYLVDAQILSNLTMVFSHHFLSSLPLLHIKNKLLVEYLIGSWGSALVLSVLILCEMRCSTCQQRPLMMWVHLAEHRSPWPANLNWVAQRRERHAVEWEDCRITPRCSYLAAGCYAGDTQGCSFRV